MDTEQSKEKEIHAPSSDGDSGKFGELVKDLKLRQQTLRGDRNLHTMFLKGADPVDLINISVSQVLKGAEANMTLVDVAVSLGNRVRQRYGEARDPVAAAHTGWFVMISYFEVGLISYYLKHNKKKGKKSKHRSYHLSLKSWGEFAELWESQDKNQLDLFPRSRPMAPWSSGYHELSYPAIRKADQAIVNAINPEDDGVFLNAINKLGEVAWSINKPVLEVFRELMDQSKGPFRYLRETDKSKIASLKIEANTILSLAEMFKDEEHYHLWSADFR